MGIQRRLAGLIGTNRPKRFIRSISAGSEALRGCIHDATVSWCRESRRRFAQPPNCSAPAAYGSTELVSHFAPTLLRRLLVFDTYVLQTVRFTEFYTLARVLGVDTVVRLLSSGTLQLELDPNQIIQIGQWSGTVRSKPPLPKGSLAFSVLLVQNGNYYDYLHRCIQDLHRQLYGYVSVAELSRLEEAIFVLFCHVHKIRQPHPKSKRFS